MEITEGQEQKILENESVRNVLENYTTVMMHKDLVDKLKQYSIIKGGDWEENLSELLEKELTGSKDENPTEEPQKVNVKKFKI